MDCDASDNTEQSFSVTIDTVDSRIVNSKRHTVYKVLVKQGQSSWTIEKRYKDFENLYDQLKQGGYKVDAELPVKRPMLERINPNSASRRFNALGVFLQKVSADTRISSSKFFRDFLKFSEEDTKISSNSCQESGGSSVNDNEEVNSSSIINLGNTQNHHIRPADFDFLKHVGKGSYGKVYMARHKAENKIYAVKVLDKSQVKKRNEIQHVMAERNVMVRIIDHPFLVKLHYSFQTADKLYFVVDFINGGELFHHLQNEQLFSEARARFYAAEIISAIGCLHSHGVIYRDLKPENILFDSEGHIKLADFGLCKEGMITSTERTSTFCGTPEYLAPEIIQKKPYTRAVDWWCCGAVLYEMLIGMPPFYNKTYRIMHHDILHKPIEFRQNISTQAKDILKKLLEKNPEIRLGAGEGDVNDVKSHKFFSNIDWQALEAKEINPPLIYKTTNNTDLRFIDPEFVNEPVPASVRHSVHLNGGSLTTDDSFLGFTYVNAPVLEKEDNN